MSAERVVSKISRDEKWYARYVAEMKNKIDLMFAEERGRKEGIQQGIQEGIQQGIQEGMLEVARKMKAAGRPLSEIEEFTGLSKEQIKEQ